MSGGSRRDEYFPALDGLRAVAVLVVVAFHAGWAEARGGFLGVSLFFTLSGFLITRLLLAEHDRTGRIALRAFWGRRVRRLAPAALLCLALVVATSRWLVTHAEMRSLRGDVVAAAANVANWRFVAAGQSYASLFAGRPSPVLHFWSLAIEEQFYLVFPCIVVVLLLTRRRWAVPVGFAVLLVGSVLASLLATDHDLIYYGTHTRAGELLVGALLAWWMARRHAPSAVRRERAVGIGAIAGMIGFGWLVVNVSQGDGWLYRGGFTALASMWCPLIVGAISSCSFARVLGVGPLAAIGRRSYGIYVFHWPVFTLLGPNELHLHGWPARVVQFAIVGALTEVSYRWVERPIRTRRVLRNGGAMRSAALVAIAAVIAAAVVVPAAITPASATISMVDAPDAPVLLPSVNTVPDVPAQPVSVAGGIVAAPATTAPVATIRVVVVGSDPAVVEALRRSDTDPARLDLVDDVRPGCSIIAFDDAAGQGRGCVIATPFVPLTDILVVAVGPADHAAVEDRLAVSRSLGRDEAYTSAEQLDQLGVSTFDRLAHSASRVIVVDTVEAHDVLASAIAEAAVSNTTTTVHQLGDIDAAFVDRLVAPTAAAPRLRVMVIGDSTSYGVAQGLAASGRALDVLWAGKRNCPLIAMDESTLLGTENSMTGCPSVHAVWPEQLASFRPDVVLAVDSLPEESRQRYAGDPEWHEPGSPTYAKMHDDGLRDLLGLIAPYGAVVELADAPKNAVDSPGDWTSDADIAAWNAQLQSWDAQWAPVEILGYAGLVEAAEAAAGHTLRPDGAHLDDASVASIIGGSLAPLLVQQVIALRLRLVGSGCLVPAANGPSLDLPACG